MPSTVRSRLKDVLIGLPVFAGLMVSFFAIGLLPKLLPPMAKGLTAFSSLAGSIGVAGCFGFFTCTRINAAAAGYGTLCYFLFWRQLGRNADAVALLMLLAVFGIIPLGFWIGRLIGWTVRIRGSHTA